MTLTHDPEEPYHIYGKSLADRVQELADTQGIWAYDTPALMAVLRTNVKLGAEVGYYLADWLGTGRYPTVGLFDNCREYGLTFESGGWTFCVYEHRNSDSICIEGCPTDEVKSYGPYGGVDNYDTIACFQYDTHTSDVARVMAELLHQATQPGTHTREAFKRAAQNTYETITKENNK